MEESKITKGAKYLIKVNSKKLKGLKALAPMKLEHSDPEKSKKYKNLLQFYVTLGEEILTLEENHNNLKNALANIVNSIDDNDQLDYKEVEKLKEFL